MNPWAVGAAGMLLALVAPGIVALRARDPVDRLVALEMAGVEATLLLTLLVQIDHRASFLDLPLALALLSFGGALVFARFLERWL